MTKIPTKARELCYYTRTSTCQYDVRFELGFTLPHDWIVFSSLHMVGKNVQPSEKFCDTHQLRGGGGKGWAYDVSEPLPALLVAPRRISLVHTAIFTEFYLGGGKIRWIASRVWLPAQTNDLVSGLCKRTRGRFGYNRCDRNRRRWVHRGRGWRRRSP